MLGEVWPAGGQSNMEWPLQSQVGYEKYLPAETKPEEFGDIDTNRLEWKYFDQESVLTFSAVTYFFALELQKRLGVTVGVIGSYRGQPAMNTG